MCRLLFHLLSKEKKMEKRMRKEKAENKTSEWKKDYIQIINGCKERDIQEFTSIWWERENKTICIAIAFVYENESVQRVIVRQSKWQPGKCNPNEPNETCRRQRAKQPKRKTLRTSERERKKASKTILTMPSVAIFCSWSFFSLIRWEMWSKWKKEREREKPSIEASRRAREK